MHKDVGPPWYKESMSNEKRFAAPERVVERGRGCWNCIHFKNDDLVRQHYQAKTAEERALANAASLIPSFADDDQSHQAMAHEAAKLVGTHKISVEEAVNTVLAAKSRQDPRVAAALADARQRDARFHIFDRAVAAGGIGICAIGRPKSDFVDCRYLCDGWTGRDGASVATAGKPLDKLPEEVREDIEPKTRKAD